MKLCFSDLSKKTVGAVSAICLQLFVTAVNCQPIVKGATSSQLSTTPLAHAASTAATAASGIASVSIPLGAASAPLFAPDQPKPLTPAPLLSSLETTNIFDPQGKVWPDKRPPAPPPPLPPLPPLVTDKDLQLYGVVIVGATKRATIKVGSRFAQLDTQGRGFVTVSEGQVIGEWVLAEIHPGHLVLGAPGGQQTVMFNKKTDRVASATMPALQQTSAANTEPVSSPPVSSPASSQPSDGNTPRPATPTATGSTASSSAATSAMTDNAIKNAQPGSLAAAIFAAQSAAQSAPSQNASPPANFNPFLNLLPKQ